MYVDTVFFRPQLYSLMLQASSNKYVEIKGTPLTHHYQTRPFKKSYISDVSNLLFMKNLILVWSFSHFISILLLIRGIGVGTTWIWTSLYSQPFCTKLSSPSDLEIILQISMHPKVLLVVHVLSEDNTIYRNDLLLSWVWTDPWLFIPQRGPQLVLFIIILDQLNMSNYLWKLLFNYPQLSSTYTFKLFKCGLKRIAHR